MGADVTDATPLRDIDSQFQDREPQPTDGPEYHADHQAWTERQEWITKDSGERVDFPSGMRRDVDTGKPRYDLIPGMPLKRLADLYARGAEKYGDSNWQLANSWEELQRFRASAARHFHQWMDGDLDEDHASAIVFNVWAYLVTEAKLNDPRN